MIATRDQNILQRYDLQTLQKELTVPLQDVGQVLAIGMGCASAGPAMLLTTNGVRFVDVAKLAPVNVKGDEAVAIAVRNLPVQNQAQVRASADGTLFVMGGANGRPRMVFLEGDTVRVRNENMGEPLLPGPDGNYLFSSTGVYSADGRSLSAEFRGMLCLPAYHPSYFLGFVPTGTVRRVARPAAKGAVAAGQAEPAQVSRSSRPTTASG